MKALVERAARGAALLRGEGVRPSYVLLADLIEMDRSQLTRWASGATIPKPAALRRLQLLAEFAEKVDAMRHDLTGYLNAERESRLTLRLHEFAGWSFDELEATNNPLGADYVKGLVKRRRKAKCCDLCGAQLPRAAYPASDPDIDPERMHRNRPRPVGFSAEGKLAIGGWVCAACRAELDA